MKILFMTRKARPEIGGVEKHIYEITKRLKVKGQSVKVISENDVKYPHVKLLGLFFIWLWLFKNKKLILNADVIHIHDVFIWYLPFKFLYPRKKVVTTIHGLEWDNPLSKISLFQKKLAVKLSDKSVGIGKFLEKYVGVRFDLISYGAKSINRLIDSKDRNSYVYVGRLEENTGLLKFLSWSSRLDHRPVIDFVGDGRMRKECEKYGKVHGFCDPTRFLKKAEYCIPGGYLAALEGLGFGCKLKLFWNNKVKEDYWRLSPFVKKDVVKWSKSQTWEKIANEYINLYTSIK